MGLIKYFKKLKEMFSIRRQFRRENTERFYAKCKEGIFSFFKPSLTANGFYLDLEDKEGLAKFFKNESNRKTENTIFNESQRTNESTGGFQKKVEEYANPIYGVFERMVKYFKEFPKENLREYDSLSFQYRPFREGCTTKSHGNKLEFLFG